MNTTNNKYSPRLKYEVQARGERMAFTSRGAALAHASDLLMSAPPVPVILVRIPPVKWS
jgi:hypothetical protein